ncbi:MAG: GIY-YIG nuclease family protein [Bacteroidota bacterium]
MAYTYILHSPSISKFYIGSYHGDLSSRIEAHNGGKYGAKAYTSVAGDWTLLLKFECGEYAHAIRLERKIKSIKSEKYVENLITYPKLRQKIFNATRGT